MKKFALIGIVVTAFAGPLFGGGSQASAATNPWCGTKHVIGSTDLQGTLWPC